MGQIKHDIFHTFCGMVIKTGWDPCITYHLQFFLKFSSDHQCNLPTCLADKSLKFYWIYRYLISNTISLWTHWDLFDQVKPHKYWHFNKLFHQLKKLTINILPAFIHMWRSRFRSSVLNFCSEFSSVLNEME